MRSLVLSGGGARGCFEAGVLYELFDKIQFDNISGTSVGALNTMILTQCYIDNDKSLLKEVWTEMIKKNKDVFKKNYFKTVIGNPPYKFSPLRKKIQNKINFQKIIDFKEKKVMVTAVDLKSGKTIVFSNQDKDITAENLLDATIASSSAPPAFQPIKINEYQLVDGGVRDNVPVHHLIDNPKYDSAIVILCNPKDIQIEKEIPNSLLKVGFRVIDIMMNEITRNDVNNILRLNSILADLKGKFSKNEWLKNKDILKVKIICPEEPVSDDSLNFIQEKLIKGFETGIEKAKEFLNNNPIV